MPVGTGRKAVMAPEMISVLVPKMMAVTLLFEMMAWMLLIHTMLAIAALMLTAVAPASAVRPGAGGKKKHEYGCTYHNFDHRCFHG